MQEVLDRSRALLGLPDDYRLGIVPASDTGAVEMALWSLLGERGVDVLSWESFGSGWLSDIEKQLGLTDMRSLSADYGRKAWSYTAGGRIDSSPTLYKGLVIFGSADGWVTCLDGRDGQLVWRFRAAPQQHVIVNHGRLESSWPVHGSVLLHNGELVFTAGRSSYLDGGIYLYRVDPLTGKMLACSVISHLDPVTGKQTGTEARGSFDSEGTISDVLSADGESIFLKHMGFDRSDKEAENTRPHLFSPTGLLGEEWFIRAYWLYGTGTGQGTSAGPT